MSHWICGFDNNGNLSSNLSIGVVTKGTVIDLFCYTSLDTSNVTFGVDPKL